MRLTRLTKKMKIVAGLGAFLMLGIVQSQAANIQFMQEEYGRVQEQLGRNIKEAGWLEYNRGRIQETLGRFIQEGGPEGNVLQEELGSGIAAAAHIRWRTIGTQEAIAASIIRVAKIVRQDVQIALGMVQEGLGEMILLDAREAYAASQEIMGKEVLRQAQLEDAGSIMATALQASLSGEKATPISQKVIDTIRRNHGYTQLANFVLAVNMLERETGISLSPLVANMSNLPTFGSAPVTDQGWGGFAEYGFFAIAGFVFAMWASGWVILKNGAPMEEKEEAEYELYQKAA